jgi:sporulation protein YlmC with PRC-barrel domain
MKLRLGQPVRTLDGPFGELADIVVDPVAREVTHLVVEPHHRHLQSRLVPIGLVEPDSDATLALTVDSAHVRSLPQVAFSEFVPIASPIDVGERWDIANVSVIAQPYWAGDSRGDLIVAGQMLGDKAQVSYDRVPKGECEIRRQSRVIDADGHVLGRVEGLFVEDEHVTAVIVRIGLPGFHHFVVAPLGAIDAVGDDAIHLSIGRDAVDALPSASDLTPPDGDTSMPSALQVQLGTVLHHTGRRARQVRDALASRLHRSHHDETGRSGELDAA